ncbi:MAG: hypothetical protein ABSE16_07850 [Verrucomicrobiota bacterium]|jgi:hypothetical protein
MVARLFNLLLCALLLGLSGPAAKAITRPENRVGGSPVFSSDFASQVSANPIGTRAENPGCGYDFASGVHKYLYTEDNPVNMSDPLGKWATFIHKEAIDHALETSLLPASDRQTLKDEQDEVDRDQKAVDSYRHAMSDGSSDPPQAPAQAQQQADNYVLDLLTKARAAEAKNDHTTALQDLGQAIHALQDSTSPAHHGFQPWYDYKGGVCNPHEWWHASKESINPGPNSWLYIATDESYDYFHDTSKPLPSDFFNDLGADSVGDEFKHWFLPNIDIIPDVDLSFTADTIAGFAF